MLLPRIVLCTALLASANAFAISNIESQRPGPPPEGWSGQLEFTASGKSGNVEENRYALGGRLAHKTGDNLVFAIVEAAEAKSLGTKTADDAFVHTRWMHEQTERVTLEGFLQWQENAFANLVSRYLVGGGVRLQLLEEPEVYELAVGIGAFREWEETDLGTFNRSTDTWRINNYWSYRQSLNDQVNWYATAYYQPSAEDFDDYRVLFDTGLTVRLTGSLQLRVSYNLNHNSHPPRNLDATPPIDRAETNTQYSTTFLYEF